MDPETFSLLMLAALANIRTALWMLDSAVAAVAVAILVHALLTRRR